MSSLEPDQCNTKESCIQKALNAYNSKQYSSIRKAAHAFAIPYSTMKNRVSGKVSQAKAQELVQNLSNAEEKTLVRWITRLTITGFLASPKLVLEMAEEICWECLFLVLQVLFGSLGLCLIGHNWFTQFKQCNSEISSIWIRQIASSRFKAITPEVIKPWFDVVAKICLEYCYLLEHCYNMNESRFVVGVS